MKFLFTSAFQLPPSSAPSAHSAGSLLTMIFAGASWPLKMARWASGEVTIPFDHHILIRFRRKAVNHWIKMSFWFQNHQSLVLDPAYQKIYHLNPYQFLLVALTTRLCCTISCRYLWIISFSVFHEHSNEKKQNSKHCSLHSSGFKYPEFVRVY